MVHMCVYVYVLFKYWAARLFFDAKNTNFNNIVVSNQRFCLSLHNERAGECIQVCKDLLNVHFIFTLAYLVNMLL